MNNLLGRFAAAALLAAAVSTASAAPIVIDDFTTSSMVSANAGATLVATTSPAGSVLGGERDLLVELTGGVSNLMVATNAFGSHTLQYAAGAGVVGRAILTYDGVDADAETVDAGGLGGLDLTADGNSAFLLGGVFADHAASFTILVFDAADASATTWSSATVTLGPLATPSNLHIHFADFATHGPGGAADLTNIGAIQLHLYDSGARSLDVELDSLMIVPEPAAAASLLAALGCGVVLFRRRDATRFSRT